MCVGVRGVGVGLRGGALVGIVASRVIMKEGEKYFLSLDQFSLHVHSKPGFEIKFEITVFEVKPSSRKSYRHIALGKKFAVQFHQL